MATARKRGNVMAMDPDPYMKRMLHYRERHSGWYIFRAIYIGVYLLLVGFILMFREALNFSITFSAGVSLVILALMVMLYGFVASLHLKLMKKYG